VHVIAPNNKQYKETNSVFLCVNVAPGEVTTREAPSGRGLGTRVLCAWNKLLMCFFFSVKSWRIFSKMLLWIVKKEQYLFVIDK